MNDLFSLAGERAFITGGTSGIGRAVAEAFVAQGATVVVADIVDVADGTAIANEIGARFVSVDVSNEDSVRNALGQAAELCGGKFDTVVLNAGVGDVGPTFEKTDQALIDKVTRINHWGVLYGLKHAPGRMNDGGSIISTSSMAAFINVPGAGVYSAGKRAVTSMTEMAALELGARGIRVNCVCPGYTATAMGSGVVGQKLCEAFTALGRVATVDDMAGVYVFLASDASSYMTGQSLKVDGGWHCGPTEKLLELVTGDASAPG
jgi:3(or 17)beta-hydroxysteroid dehydrogenase